MTDTVIQIVTVESDKASSVVLNPPGGNISNNEIYNVVVTLDSIHTIAAGQPGPQGPSGISEEEMAYAKQTDFVTDSEIYRGEAAVGSSTSDSVWRIRKILIASDNDISETWADGNANFDNIWDDRLILSYS